MNAIEKAVYLQNVIDICHPSFEDLNVRVQNISISPVEDCLDTEYLTVNYLLFRTGRQSKQYVRVFISLYDCKDNILQIQDSLSFALKKRSLPYVGKITMGLKHPVEKIAKIGVYLQED